jgi:hypothetical protein
MYYKHCNPDKPFPYIKKANDRLVLKKFGGPLTIEEFRTTFDYRVSRAPFTMILENEIMQTDELGYPVVANNKISSSIAAVKQERNDVKIQNKKTSQFDLLSTYET